MFNVVFEGTEAAGGYKGVITFCSFNSESELEKYLERGGVEAPKLRVLARDISSDECQEMCRQTPSSSLAASAIQDATRPDGSIDTRKLERKLTIIIYTARAGIL